MFQFPYFGGTSRHGVPQRRRQSMPLIIERLCSGRRPRPRFAASIGSKLFKTSHSASLRSPRLNPFALHQPIRPRRLDHVSWLGLRRLISRYRPLHGDIAFCNVPFPFWQQKINPSELYYFYIGSFHNIISTYSITTLHHCRWRFGFVRSGQRRMGWINGGPLAPKGR